MPHIWEGCDFFAWMRLLAGNHFAVHWSYWHVVAIVTFVSLFHTVFRWLQAAWYGNAIKRLALSEPPIFIVGHWRTGTTLLHELLILDPRHGYPTTYECMEPNHFLLTERLITRWLRFLLPSRRPMDNMAVSWDRPQEDEFALCMMGQPSPYLDIAFPNRPPLYPESLALDGLSPRRLASWKQAFLHFVKCVTWKNPGKRLVLKSPTHSCRIPVLRDLFPGARFVHIVRDPYVVFPSTVNLWKSLYQTHGLQRPTFAGLEENVFSTFTYLYERLEEGKAILEPGHFHELRYEDLVRDPVGQMRLLYTQLGLGGFDDVLPRLERYLKEHAGYQTNRYERSPQMRAEITRRWGDVIRRYGYGEQPFSREPPASATSAFAEGSRLNEGG